jgi:zinc transport system ATP-binding protein
MADPLISIQSATFGYDREPVLSDVTLFVEKGDFIGLIGPNGAGKSTLLKGCLGLVSPMAGHIQWDLEAMQHVGYVPQRDRLDPIFPLTAYDVVGLGIAAQRPWWVLRDAADPSRIQRALAKTGLLEISDHSFADLSGGQRQRVLVARALVMDPQLLILDEPTSGADRYAEEAIFNLLSELNRSEHKTILVVSHHHEKIRPVVSRLLTVEDGLLHE